MNSFAKSAYEILEGSILSKPRMMGTSGEAETTRFLLDFLDRHGLSPSTEEIEWTTAAVRGRKFLFMLAGLFALSFYLALRATLPAGGILALVLPLLAAGSIFWFIKGLKDDRFKSLGTTASGRNVVCDIAPQETGQGTRTIYLTAHSDSVASSMPKVYIKVMIAILWLFGFVLVQTLLFGISSVLGRLTAGQIAQTRQLVLWAGAAQLVLTGVYLFARRVNTSPGACDNGSGSAILLALAGHFAQNPPLSSRLKFIWFAAEEWGLYGSKGYVATHQEEIAAQREKSLVINVDMVGTELAYLNKAGFIFKKPLNKYLNTLIAETARELEIEARPFNAAMSNNSDHAPFHKEKVEVCFFLAKKDTKRIHSPNDTLEFVRPEKLDDAVCLIKGVVGKLDNTPS